MRFLVTDACLFFSGLDGKQIESGVTDSGTGIFFPKPIMIALVPFILHENKVRKLNF